MMGTISRFNSRKDENMLQQWAMGIAKKEEEKNKKGACIQTRGKAS